MLKYTMGLKKLKQKIVFEVKMGKSYKLLIIDDDAEILSSMYNYFRKKNYDIVSASNGLDALKILQDDQESFDLIITDLVMPNVGGVAIIAIVKQKHPGTPIIAMTGWGSDPEILASEAQADMVLGKPFKLAELEIIIKQLISKNNQT